MEVVVRQKADKGVEAAVLGNCTASRSGQSSSIQAFCPLTPTSSSGHPRHAHKRRIQGAASSGEQPIVSQPAALLRSVPIRPAPAVSAQAVAVSCSLASSYCFLSRRLSSLESPACAAVWRQTCLSRGRVCCATAGPRCTSSSPPPQSLLRTIDSSLTPALVCMSARSRLCHHQQQTLRPPLLQRAARRSSSLTRRRSSAQHHRSTSRPAKFLSRLPWPRPELREGPPNVVKAPADSNASLRAVTGHRRLLASARAVPGAGHQLHPRPICPRAPDWTVGHYASPIDCVIQLDLRSTCGR